MSFIERATELCDRLIVGGLREMVKPDGQGVGFRVGNQIHFIVEDLTQQGPGIVGADATDGAC